MSKSQAAGELLRLCLAAQRDQRNFPSRAHPRRLLRAKPELFDRNYMTALFRAGFEMGQKGTAWQESPALCAADLASIMCHNDPLAPTRGAH